MAIVLKKKELKAALLSIASFDAKTGEIVGGLLTEKISLGLKRKLQKIHEAVQKEFQQMLKDIEEIKKIENEEEQNKEFNDILEEDVTLLVDKARLDMIETIETDRVYDFTLLEKIAE
jgi:hypothetical protein